VDSSPMQDWLISGRAARVGGLELKPKAHPLMPGSPLCLVRGQAAVYPLLQPEHGNTFFLKKFTESRRPEREYIENVARCLPGGAEFLAGAQRRVLGRSSLGRWNSGYYVPALADWLDGTVLTPRVPGASWSEWADGLRAGDSTLSPAERVTAALSLVQAVIRLEAVSAAHRDLSAANLFLDAAGRASPIDWDCLFHPSLEYQPNTTVGTSGYLAPFLRAASGEWKAAASWCEAADRYALAVLAVEILLLGPGSPPAQEDGSLFSQEELCGFADGRICGLAQGLAAYSARLCALFEQASKADSFAACPKPDEWQSALRHVQRIGSHKARSSSGSRPPAKGVWQKCAGCGKPDRIDAARLKELEERNRPVLCRACLTRDLAQRSELRLQQDRERPEVVCEHCSVTFRTPRERLELLRAKGRPLLCPTCLRRQMQKWYQERQDYEVSFPKIVCARCARPFRMGKEKLESLRSKAKAPLCKGCFQELVQEWAEGVRFEAHRGPLQLVPVRVSDAAQVAPVAGGKPEGRSLRSVSSRHRPLRRGGENCETRATGETGPSPPEAGRARRPACSRRRQQGSGTNAGRETGMVKLLKAIIAALRRLVLGGPSAPPQGQAKPNDYLKIIQGPGTRVTTMRILDRESVDQGVISLHERLEGTDANGHLRQVDAYHSTLCGFGHFLGRDAQPKSLCHICGKLMCSTEGCHGQPCRACGKACCPEHRIVARPPNSLADDKTLTVTYCRQWPCSCKRWWDLWWGIER